MDKNFSISNTINEQLFLFFMFLNHFITAKEFLNWLTWIEGVDFLLILSNIVLLILLIFLLVVFIRLNVGLFTTFFCGLYLYCVGFPFLQPTLSLIYSLFRIFIASRFNLFTLLLFGFLYVFVIFLDINLLKSSLSILYRVQVFICWY